MHIRRKTMLILCASVALLAGLVWLGYMRLSPRDDIRLTTLHDAINAQNLPAAERLSQSKATIEQRDQAGATPLISACSSGQFRIAEILIKSGADVFAVDDFGVTAGRMAWASRIAPNTEEGRARERVLALMKDKGFPFPPPNSDVVSKMVQEGSWPPK